MNTEKQLAEVDAGVDVESDTSLSTHKIAKRVKAWAVPNIVGDDDDENNGGDGAANGEKVVRDPVVGVGKDEVGSELEMWCLLPNTIGASIETNGEP